jgi:hypothetical protein
MQLECLQDIEAHDGRQHMQVLAGTFCTAIYACAACSMLSKLLKRMSWSGNQLQFMLQQDAQRCTTVGILYRLYRILYRQLVTGLLLCFRAATHLKSVPCTESCWQRSCELVL